MVHTNSLNNQCLNNFSCISQVRVGDISPVNPVDVNVETSSSTNVSALVQNQQTGSTSDHAQLILNSSANVSDYVTYSFQAGPTWAAGYDQSTGNFFISSVGIPTSGELFYVTSGNQVLLPRQSTFDALSDVTQSNVTWRFEYGHSAVYCC